MARPPPMARLGGHVVRLRLQQKREVAVRGGAGGQDPGPADRQWWSRWRWTVGWGRLELGGGNRVGKDSQGSWGGGMVTWCPGTGGPVAGSAGRAKGPASRHFARWLDWRGWWGADVRPREGTLVLE